VDRGEKMNRSKPFAMAKRYILLDEAQYKNHTNKDRENRVQPERVSSMDRQVSEEKPYPKVNPFQNPRVREAKADRRKLWDTLQDDNLTVEEANLKVKQLIDRYRLNFSRATGGGKRKIFSGGENDVKRRKLVDKEPKSGSKVKTHPTPKGQAQARPRNYFKDIQHVKSVLRGVTTDEDAQKILPLMNELVRVGAIKGDKFQNVTDAGFVAKPEALKNLIREASLVDPDRRTVSQQKLNRFKDYLKRKDIRVDIPDSQVRKTEREKQPSRKWLERDQ
jgi:hypothetical protein